MTPGPKQAATYELPRGTQLGKYEIERRIETGGMAEIYLARARGTAGFEKLVVLKRILPNVAEDPTLVQMFLDEARLAATLQHPNIADVYDVGEVAGTYFFTMEYVHGQDLRAIRGVARKNGDSVPMSIALAIVHGIAAALDYAHERQGPDGKLLGLVHRDVSPSNIVVSYDGAVKLVDFGIARVSSGQHKTQTGTLKGKIPYMSPEQTRGLPLDRRSDLFSLGTVLYELTVGRRPFRGESDFEIMDQIVNVGAAPPRKLAPEYPEDLETIVMHLLERAPSQRYTTADELMHDLDEFIQRHRLWVTSKSLGKYMRTLFADKIQAWEDAEQHGVPLSQHVADSITSKSQKSELVTPPSAYPGLPPRTSSQMDVEPSQVIQPSHVPDVRPASHRLAWITAVALSLVIGGIAGLMLLPKKQKPSAAPPAEEHVQMKPEAPPPPPPVPEPPPKQPELVAAPVEPPTVKESAAGPAPAAAKKTVRPKAIKPNPKEDPKWDPNAPFLPQ